MRGWVLFWCVQSFAWAWDAPAAVERAPRELAPDPYSRAFELAPDPHARSNDAPGAPALVNRRSRRSPVAARLAPSPYHFAQASLAPMPYVGGMPERELARPSSQPLSLAASPYDRQRMPELAPDPY